MIRFSLYYLKRNENPQAKLLMLFVLLSGMCCAYSKNVLILKTADRYNIFGNNNYKKKLIYVSKNYLESGWLCNELKFLGLYTEDKVTSTYKFLRTKFRTNIFVSTVPKSSLNPFCKVK